MHRPWDWIEMTASWERLKLIDKYIALHRQRIWKLQRFQGDWAACKTMAHGEERGDDDMHGPTLGYFPGDKQARGRCQDDKTGQGGGGVKLHAAL